MSSNGIKFERGPDLPESVEEAIVQEWSIIPCNEDKKPLVCSWKPFQITAADRQQIIIWHKELQPAAWAVVTGALSKLVVLDFDGQSGISLVKRLGLSPNVKTGSAGLHVYAEHPGHRVRSNSGKSKRVLGAQFPGLDIRGDGGYAVFTGRNRLGTYEQLAPFSARTSLLDLPGELRILLGLGGSGTNSFLFEKRKTIANGLVEQALHLSKSEGRNNAGFWLACQLRDEGFSEQEAKEFGNFYALRTGKTNQKDQRELYTEMEFSSSLRQAFTRNPRRGSTSLKDDDVSRSIEDVFPTLGPGSSHRDPTIDPRWIDNEPKPAPLARAALHGVTGDLVTLIMPHTESSLAAILVQFLVITGVFLGRTAYYAVEGDRHYPNLFAVLVGSTSKGRKGTSFGQVRRVSQIVDASFTENCITSGISSGEGLIWAVRDEIREHRPIRERGNGRVIEYENVISDAGVSDKRLLAQEPEFSRLLKNAQREGNNVSAVLREAWDSGNLNVLTKNKTARVTNAHIGVIAHITKEELRKVLTDTEVANGFANRFLWIYTERSKELPFGGELRNDDLQPIARHLRAVQEHARSAGQIGFESSAAEDWRRVYSPLSASKPGLVGAVIGRAEAQVVRVATLYALLDCDTKIRRSHLQAAIAVWDYAESSAQYIFRDAIGDDTADWLLNFLRSRGTDGATRTDLSKLFCGNKTAREIRRGLNVLFSSGKASFLREVQRNGPPVEIWFANGQAPGGHTK